ncbi:MAG: hypothetical protein MJK07_16385 [Flavobacteriales bacterium]|nr:hypothetical protein [Flavobacteriales bacterium]
MNKLFLILISGLIGCSAANNNSTSIELIDTEEGRDTTTTGSYDSNLLPIDTSIIEGISLLNETSLLLSFDTVPYYYERKFLLFDNDNILVMHGNLGGKKNTYSYYDLYKSKDDYKRCEEGVFPFDDVKFSKFDISLNFKTENNIRLGISRSEIINLKGEEYETYRNGNIEVISYQYSDRKHVYLRKSNMPLYEMKFFLENGILVRYSFGFPQV